MSTKKQTDYLTPIKENMHKLEFNKPYKFTDLCRTLNLKVPNNKDSKIALLKNLDSLVDRYEENKKHIITGIRSEAKELVRNGRGSSELSVNIQTALMGFLLANKDNYNMCSYDEKHKTYTMHIPTNTLIERLNMFNYENYRNAKYHTDRYADTIGVSLDIVSENIDTIYKDNHNKFKRELTKLDSNNLIHYTENILIKKRHIEVDYCDGEIYLDENGNVTTIIEEDEEYRVASPQEVMNIKHIKRNFLNKHNLKNEGELMFSADRDKYYKELNSIMKSRLNIVAQRKVHTIMFKVDSIIGYLDRFAKSEDLDFYRDYLGDSFVDNKLKNAIDRHNRAVKKAKEDAALIDINSDKYNEVIALRYTDTYVEGSKKVHNSIKPSAKCFTMKLKTKKQIQMEEILDKID